MSGLVDKLKLKEQAEEDVYFARRDRELLRAKGESAPRPDRDRPTVVSGGQTGVDRAALAAALELGLAVGGWCPAGRRAEDGAIPDAFPLQQTPSSDYPERTDWNVRDSDATVILHRGPLSGGTRLTAELARNRGRPFLSRDLQEPLDPDEIAHWLHLNRVRVLNCAGPRESQAPGITEQARSLLVTVFRLWIAADA